MVVRMAVQMTAGLGCALRVDAEVQRPPTSLLRVALAWHVALTLGNGRAVDLVVAETLSSVLGTGDGEAARVAVGGAFVVGDGVLAYVGELDAGHETVLGVGVAAFVGPAGGCGWRRARGGDGGPDDGGLGDVGGYEGVA